MRRTLLTAAVLLVLGAAPAGAASKYVVRGHGNGHGVGLSQWGAYGYAQHGLTYDRILRHYYTGTTLGTAAGKQIRVLLQSGRGTISFTGATRAGSKKLSRTKTYTARLAFGSIVVRHGDKQVGAFSSPLRIASSRNSLRLGGTALNGVADGAYRGALELRPSGGSGLMAINAVSSDDYVKGVVPGEVPPSWPAEALKAQAVAARSYGLTTHASTVFDQYPDTRSQVYRGMGSETAPTNAAVDATAGQVVRYGDRIATTFFFSSSGGHTEDVQNSFYGSPSQPYLRGVVDRYDTSAPRHTWKLTFTKARVQAKLGSLVKGTFRGIAVVKRGVSPRVVWADVIGSRGRTRVRGAALRARLGLYDTWATFPSLKKPGGAPAPAAKAAEPPAAAQAPAPATAPPPAPAESWRWPAATWRARSEP
ncbi:MAG TPA: SpoIID/LytB domain-containing protein [Thermoleophilaceae bacterium]|jgi:stage II sporulation protein D